LFKLSPLTLPLSSANGGEGGVRGKDKKANSYTIKVTIVEKGALFLSELTDTFEVQSVPQNKPHELQQATSHPKTGLLPPLDTPSSPSPTGRMNDSLSPSSSAVFQAANPTPLTLDDLGPDL